MKISLILPYWDRQEAANKAFELLDKHYSYLHMEVIVVDDGNKVPFVCPETRLDVRVIRLPEKHEPTPQSIAYNEGVKAATGEIIVLSCIEILHETNVIEPMLGKLFYLGELGYVLASAWCPEESKWHCHTTEIPEYCPIGTGASFCSMLYKDTFNLAGGFDIAYKKGAGYEDKDFIHRMLSIGAKFLICDDLKVIHPKTGAKIKWKSDGFRRNKAIFLHKWPEAKEKPVNVICLKAGAAYGPEYVNILHDMVARNLTAGTPGKFVCITDNPEGLECETIPLPEDLETWWGKLYMFKRGLFNDGERCIFMDLDTLIIGNIDWLLKYQGKFATLRDFYFPQQIGPAIIAWEAGEFSASIWDEWVVAGKPRHPQGDLWWLNNLDQGRFARKIDILQDIFPEKFASFKADCHPFPPQNASVICFHGQPKPDNCMVDWVNDVWKIGGSGKAELEAIANTNQEEVKNNILSACARDLKWLQIEPEHDRQAVIVAGGPSLIESIGEVKWRQAAGQAVIAVNGTAKFLNQNDIIPDIHIIIDSRPGNARFISESTSKAYWLASQCHPSIFDNAPSAGLFHMNTYGISDFLPKDKEANLISSGTTAGLAAMAVAYCLGYRALHLHGFDSSYDNKHHAYEQPENDRDSVIEVSVNGRKFKSSPWMVRQVQDFQSLSLQLLDNGVIITVAGDGLLPHVAHCMSK